MMTALMGNFEVQQQRAPHQDSELHSVPALSWSRARLHAFPSHHSQLTAQIRRKTLSGSHLQIGIEFQPWGSLLRPSASCPVWSRSAPFGAPDSQHSIPTTLAHPTRPGTAPDPHRSLTVDNNVIYGEATVCLRRG